MHDWRRVDLRLKVQPLQAEAVESDGAPLHNRAHCLLLTRCIGWSKRKRTGRPLSYAETLLRTGCEDTIEAAVRKRRLCFTGFVMRVEDDRPPKLVLLGALATGKGQESDRVSHLGDNVVAFGLDDNKD